MTPGGRCSCGSADYEVAALPAGKRHGSPSEVSGMYSQAVRSIPGGGSSMTMTIARAKRISALFLRLMAEAGIFVEGV